MTLPVYNPLGGEHLLLHWYTYDDRGHVVLVPAERLAFGSMRTLRAERSMLHIARRLMRENSDLELKAYALVELVAPSAQMHALAIKRHRADAVDSFRTEIVFRMREVMEAGQELPAPFGKCAKFDPEYADADADEWTRDRHTGCRHCKDCITSSISPEDLYDRYAAKWRADPSVKPWPVREPAPAPRSKRVESRARPAYDGEPLCYALAEFGDHAKGVTLNKVDLSEAEDYTPSYLGDRVLFFYRVLLDMGTTQLQTFLEEARAEHAAAKKRRADESQRQHDAREQEQRKSNREAVRFFKETT